MVDPGDGKRPAVQPLRGVRGRSVHLRKRVAAEPFTGLPDGALAVSGGLTEYLPGGPVPGTGVRVDRALYRLKAAGRNRMEVADGGAAQEGSATSGCPDS